MAFLEQAATLYAFCKIVIKRVLIWCTKSLVCVHPHFALFYLDLLCLVKISRCAHFQIIGCERFWHYSSDCLFHKNLLSFHQFFFRTKVLLDILNRGISLTHHIKMHSVICKINLLLSSDTRSSICINTFSNVITLAKKQLLSYWGLIEWILWEYIYS